MQNQSVVGKMFCQIILYIHNMTLRLPVPARLHALISLKMDHLGIFVWIADSCLSPSRPVHGVLGHLSTSLSISLETLHMTHILFLLLRLLYAFDLPVQHKTAICMQIHRRSKWSEGISACQMDRGCEF